MKFRVAILRDARRDIDRNANCWADQYSNEQALRWSDVMYDHIETLADFSESHGLSDENDDFPAWSQYSDKLHLVASCQPRMVKIFRRILSQGELPTRDDSSLPISAA